MSGKFRTRPGRVVQAYKFTLDPNAGQERALRSHCGAARAACNWAVSWVTASWWQRKAEATYGIGEEELTPWRPWSLPSAYNTGLANAAAAFDNYARSKQGNTWNAESR